MCEQMTGHAAGHGLDDGQSEALMKGGKDEGLTALVDERNVLEGNPAKEDDVVLQSQLADLPHQTSSPLSRAPMSKKLELRDLLLGMHKRLEQAGVVLVRKRCRRIQKIAFGQPVALFDCRVKGGRWSLNNSRSTPRWLTAMRSGAIR
jgi:hypothetical protein